MSEYIDITNQRQLISEYNEMELENVIEVLNAHHKVFEIGNEYAELTRQPTPEDSRAWSQILVSIITGIAGPGRKKGPDLIDGSDVKAANTWGAIDTPRFNGVIKAGTLSELSGNMSYLDSTPNLYFVMWDNEPNTNKFRVRIWVTQPQIDTLFRGMCTLWYSNRLQNIIKSDNFQLHPPRNKNNNVFTNTCSNLSYPLLLSALWNEEADTYIIETYDKSQIKDGFCTHSE